MLLSFRKIMQTAAAALLALFLFHPATAQKVWTLEDCVTYALDHNLDIKKQVLGVEGLHALDERAAQEDVAAAGAGEEDGGDVRCFQGSLEFGGLAIVTGFPVLDPWLCVADFSQLCLFVLFSTNP